MVTASYNTLSPFRRETSTGSARNLVPPKRAMTATGSTAEDSAPQRDNNRGRFIAPDKANRWSPPGCSQWSPRQGFPERELPRFRKEAAILRTETFGSQRKYHTFPKGSVNHGQAASGYRTSHWGDLCEELRRYLLYRLGPAGGISTLTDKAHHKSKMNE